MEEHQKASTNSKRRVPGSVVPDKCTIPWRILVSEEQPVRVLGHGRGQSQRHGQI